ncbi:hypothetical protein OUZ56_026544 [Daphnia magna]|uniref:Integrase catalytic domain-containing protein n=1 Tax=Daphnia magna TaxID=35525 RepID=A0ABQ9ZM65_9CRUS|nr:hypothetical protein OUZ56_026544 [Daphnia magna]
MVERCQACQERPVSTTRIPPPRGSFRARLQRGNGRSIRIWLSACAGLYRPSYGVAVHPSLASLSDRAVTSNFVDLGVPTRFRSDGGTQFGADAFQTALRNWGVEWQNSSPYYAQSNGHAEASVDAMKRLVEKIAPSNPGFASKTHQTFYGTKKASS